MYKTVFATNLMVFQINSQPLLIRAETARGNEKVLTSDDFIQPCKTFNQVDIFNMTGLNKIFKMNVGNKCHRHQST